MFPPKKATLRIILSPLFAIYFVSGGKYMCNTSICLDWKLDVNKLTLTCRITNLHLRVYIDDPYGKTQAVCLPPYPFDCEAYYKNGSMLYNTITKDIQFVVNGETGQNVEGYWICRHGTGRDISKVFVSMITTKGIPSTTESGPILTFTKRRDTETTVTAHTTSYSYFKMFETNFKISSDTEKVSEELQSTQYMYTDKGREQMDTELAVILSKFFGLFIGAVVLLLLVFFVCNIWISQKCRVMHLKTEDGGDSTHSNGTAAGVVPLNVIDIIDQDDNVSAYDSINENDIISFPSDVAFDENDSNIDRKTTITTHSGKSGITSSSDNSYLDVIEDDSYLNPYQSIEIHHESVKDHNYCIINNLDMCSAKRNQLESNELFSSCVLDVSIKDSTTHLEDHDFTTAQVYVLRNSEMSSRSSSNHSESLDNNPSSSEKSLSEKTIDDRKRFEDKPDKRVANDVCHLKSNAMSLL